MTGQLMFSSCKGLLPGSTRAPVESVPRRLGVFTSRGTGSRCDFRDLLAILVDGVGCGDAVRQDAPRVSLHSLC